MMNLRPLCAILLLAPSWVWCSEGGGNVTSAVGLSIIAATLMGWFAYKLHQPLLLAYIAAGALIGPRMGLGLVSSDADIAMISEIGLVLLLFLIGLELDLKKIRASGKTLLLAGLLQFPLCVFVGLPILALLGFSWTGEHYDRLYLAVAVALSSTAIVVKLLYGKFELDTLAGRITLGVLVFQDIWAIFMLGIQPNLSHPEVWGILLSFAKGLLLVGVSFALSRFALGALFRSIAKQPELVLIASLGWCFLVCFFAHRLGLGLEMGALIAGVAISTFPYNLDVFAKIINIRDFFVTLFFVGLGMKMPNPWTDLSLLETAAWIALFVIVSRLLVLFPLLKLLGNGNRVSLLVPINLSQISEFSLVIVSLGLSLGHVRTETLSVVIYAFVLTSVASSYMIQFSHPLQAWMNKALNKIGLGDQRISNEIFAEEEPADVVLLGCHRTTSALIADWEQDRENGNTEAQIWISGMVVVDFNPAMLRQLRAHGIRAVYGDISYPETLHQAGILSTKIVVITLPDSLLKGTTNLRLLQQLKNLCPDAQVICTAESHSQAMVLYQDGANFVLQPRRLEALRLGEILAGIRNGQNGQLRELEAAQEELRQEILS
ncbi:MAG TPA: cation:proton antiporter [Fibrobacteraceae bacterium]|nr:cation:proton antiporter [Fibrobacteraceae bacterium]